MGGHWEHTFEALRLLLEGLREKNLTSVTLSTLAQMATCAAPAAPEGTGMGYSVITHHNFGHVDGSVFETQEEAMAHWKRLSRFSAHTLIGPDGQQLKYFGLRSGRDTDMRAWWTARAAQRPSV